MLEKVPTVVIISLNIPIYLFQMHPPLVCTFSFVSNP